MKTLLLSLLLVTGAATASAQYSFFVTESPAGSNAGPYTNGVRRYDVSSSGTLSSGVGISSSAQVQDPAGLFLDGLGRMYFGNRVGNGINPGSGFVSRFDYDTGAGAYAYSGSSYATGQSGTHGLAVTPGGDILAANVFGPVTRSMGGTLSSGDARDVLLSPDGKYAYVTKGITGELLQFSLSTGTLLGTFALPGATGLHWGAWRGNDLYLGDYGTSQVFGVTFDASGAVASSSSFAAGTGAISVAFSPDGNEMLVPGHTSGVINRFLWSGSAWTPNGQFTTNTPMGDIQLFAAPVPEPGSLAVLGVGAAALVRRRRR